MPAVAYGLGLADRVVRRHVAKLERVGWCARTPPIRGYGSLLWMTTTGLAGVELAGLPAVPIETVAEASPTAAVTPVAVPDPLQPAPVATPQPSTTQAPARTPEQAAERQKLIRELLGQEEPPARRRWRRRRA